MDEQPGILSMETDTVTRRVLIGILRKGNLMTEFEKQVIKRLTTVFRRLTVAEADIIMTISSRRKNKEK